MADPFPSPSPMVTPSALPPSIDIPTLTFASLAPNGGSFFENFQLGQQESLPPFNSEEFAAEITEPRVAGEPCGLGFLCDEDRMVNCTVIRAISIFFGFGDIHAGLTCPANVSYYQNCQVGFYCPTPELILPCPEGMFCPHKTSIPSIKCRRCEEEAPTLERDKYGYILLICMFSFALAYILYRVVMRYNKDRYAHFMELANRRINSMRVESLGLSQAYNNYGPGKRQEQLKRIKPQLDLIAGRLRVVALAKNQDKLSSTGSNSNTDTTSTNHSTSSSSSKKNRESVRVQSEGAITFDAKRVFDELDADGNGNLSYTELNAILELNGVQLTEFVRRMNDLGCVSANCTVVSRRVFCRHFVNVLAETSNFGPTKEEAQQLFDEIAKQGTNKYGDVEPAKFYTSSLSTFLSDPQINDLLVRLRSRQHDRSTRLSLGSAEEPTSVGDASAGFGGQRNRYRFIQREVFVANYPKLLYDITADPDPMPILSTIRDGGCLDLLGVDIAFEDLSLAVNVGGNSVKVVDQVTGRLRAGTMTALMGGSGAGKSSLLNALCGRAFYGETTGTIKVNGQNSSIEEHRDSVGFVPQDDIVYAELTVRENFIYSGKFQLPNGTPLDDIEDLADATLASLGLSRVANSIVGDVHRRGVSGGEKKRVNIGLELMSRPRALFLDEPTSGLDSSSALLVMSSLRALVENQGVTVCSVIHQPRKIIFDLFDDLILLGVGGKIVYNGPTEGAQGYVERLNYRLPAGDSVADWLIDVSSGRVEPEDVDGKTEENVTSSVPSEKGTNSCHRDDFVHNGGPSSNKVEQEFEEAKIHREVLYTSWNQHFANLPEEERKRYYALEPTSLPKSVKRPPFLKQLKVQLSRNVLVCRRNALSKLVDTFLIVGAVVLISAFEGVVEVTAEHVPDVSFDALVSGDPVELAEQLPALFRFALNGSTKLLEYALKTGVITSVLVGLTAAKAITDKRLEFFRESASGYDINAYFTAINITSGIEHSLQILLAAGAAFWLRDSLAKWNSYCASFLMLSWLCVSWALLLPLLVPPENVVLVTGFFMAFFGLLFSGGLSPVTYSDIYGGNPLLALFSGFVSPTRYFIEGLVVAEHRCLPEQSGFTQTAAATNFPPIANSFALLSLAQNDSNVREQSCSGWYWGVLPALLVGLTIRLAAAGAIHVSERSKQAKKSLWEEMKQEAAQKDRRVFKSTRMVVAIFLVVFVALFSVSSWTILRET